MVKYHSKQLEFSMFTSILSNEEKMVFLRNRAFYSGAQKATERWLDTNCEGLYVANDRNIYFEKTEDMTIFLLSDL